MASSLAVEDYLLRRLFKQLHITAHLNKAVLIYNDNMTTLAYIEDLKHLSQWKYIDIDIRHSRYHCARKVILEHISSTGINHTCIIYIIA